MFTLIATLAGLLIGYHLGTKSRANETHIYHYVDNKDIAYDFGEDGKVEYNKVHGDPNIMSWYERSGDINGSR